MAQKVIYESDGKKILRDGISYDGFEPLNHVVIDASTNLELLPEAHKWLENNMLVVKPDQYIKGRGKAGLVGLNLSWAQIKEWVCNRMNTHVKVGSVTGLVYRFIVEPYISHSESEEHYLCILSRRNEDVIFYSPNGGVGVQDPEQNSMKCIVGIDEDLSLDKFRECLFMDVSDQIKCLLCPFIMDVFQLFRALHFTYMEFNPLLLCLNNTKIYVADVAAKVDSSADYLCNVKWKLEAYPTAFSRELLPEETYIADIDARSGSSLKLVVLNKMGMIWTMVAGGGASLIYSDTICDLGYASELANYGEYSGAPTESETFEYAKTILKLMTSTPPRHDGKVLIIGGGIANFTNVAVTFQGIIKALVQFQQPLITHKVRIFVRRGGPNYLEGLRNIKKTGDDLNIPTYVFGPEFHMTEIVSFALGIKPIPSDHSHIATSSSCNHGQQPHFDSPSTQLNHASSYSSSLPILQSYTSSTKSIITMTTAKADSEHLCDNVSHHHHSDLFTSNTTAIIWGLQDGVIQSMLDFDYVCGRSTPSVVGIVYPFRASQIIKIYFGNKEILIPVFQSIEEATKKFPTASVFLNFASLRSAYDICLEALQYPQFKVISVIAEGIPDRFTQLLNKRSNKAGVLMIGPASVGAIKPGCFRIGHMGGMIDSVIASKLYRRGSVAFVTRSGGMSNELNNIIARNTDGVFEGVHIGGDRYPGSTFIEHLLRFNSYSEVSILIMLGEVGGREEYEVCEALKRGAITKPLIAWCIGTCSSFFNTSIQFGHANACANSEQETAHGKNAALVKAGALVPNSFDNIADLIKSTYLERVSQGHIIPMPEVSPLPLPMDYKWARDLGLVRKPTSFLSSICDERGSDLMYSGVSVTQILEENLGFGGTIGLLWFRKKLPSYICAFIEMCLILVADHGPAVCGAHNTIVTARAGKDLLSSLCSGLLTIGDRFGGAIDGAAKSFLNGYTSKLTPAQFVDHMKSKGKLIPGIGHLTKSVTNPDPRVEKIKRFVRASLTSTPLLDYALEVEKLVTAKKSNLILNVDGTIATCLIDMLSQSQCFTMDEIVEYIDVGVFNAIFVYGRTMGFIGHFLDQRRLKQGLYRHPWDDITFINQYDG